MPDQTSLINQKSLPLIPQSYLSFEGLEYAMLRTSQEKYLAILGQANDPRLKSFDGQKQSLNGLSLISAPLTSSNAAALRSQLPWLNPSLLGQKTSAGMGDRLGLATPGHVRAVRSCQGKVSPIFAQQSIREMARTGRTPQEVMDNAVWGVFQENWQGGFGADADHLKTTQDIDVCLAAGFTFFTIDPGEYVENQAENSSLTELRSMAKKLPPMMGLEENSLLNKQVDIENLHLLFNEEILLRAMVKYGCAVWHVSQMYQHLLVKSDPHAFELEVSVDETALPTSHAEHYYIASELKRLGVRWVSLAPRFVGEFEKGVDYIGDLTAFDQDVAGHAAIARACGPYKLSLHSGSDKFSIYPIAVHHTQGLIHLKTAGTSYLEAIRTIATVDPHFFEEIYQFCLGRYEQDKLSYHVSARLERAPQNVNASDPAQILNNFDAREILHVTFGSVLKEKSSSDTFLFYNRLLDLLEQNSNLYAEFLEKHFIRHLQPFCQNI